MRFRQRCASAKPGGDSFPMSRMMKQSRSALVFITSWFVCGPAAACRSPRPVDPSIAFTAIPQAEAGGPATLAPVAGRVSGARPNQRIVMYAKSGGVWWVQPFRSRPFTDIARDATWKNSIHLGTEYAALLVDADYRPPGTTVSPPERGGGVAAVSRVAGVGTFVPPARKTVAFSG